jgi:short-subunit dehydrogenase
MIPSWIRAVSEATYPWKLAWIIGASGAICGEIARRLAAAGVTIAATARGSEKLDQLAASNEHIKAFPADVLVPDELKAAVARIEKALGPIDLALLGAGMYVPFDVRNIDLDGFHRTMALNVDGVINAVAAVLPSMLARKAGHIAIMGSLFGYAGWPENGSYGASKAAVINLAESLKLELEGTGVAVTIINPGFVDTPLNASYDRKKKLYVMSKERCARKILEKLGQRPYEIAFPPQVAGFLKSVRALPRAVSFPLIRWFTRKTGTS